MLEHEGEGGWASVSLVWQLLATSRANVVCLPLLHVSGTCGRKVVGIKSDANRDSLLAPRAYAITSARSQFTPQVGSNLMVTPPFGTFGEDEFREGTPGVSMPLQQSFHAAAVNADSSSGFVSVPSRQHHRDPHCWHRIGLLHRNDAGAWQPGSACGAHRQDNKHHAARARNQSFHPFRQRLMDAPAVFQVAAFVKCEQGSRQCSAPVWIS
eukprot:988246-Amphidinium_carterae.1